MKRFQLVLWAAIFVLGAFLAYSTVNWTLNGNSPTQGRAAIGGSFSAQLSDGTSITQANLIGRPHVMFFGFTHCPDVCPTTLYEGSQWFKELGTDGDKVDMYFVTVDPERDTAKVLSEYLSAFDPRIKGITGSSEQINDLVKKWRVYAEKVPTDDDYTMNHTATTFLMNGKGEFVRTIAYGEDAKVAVQKLRKLISEESCDVVDRKICGYCRDCAVRWWVCRHLVVIWRQCLRCLFDRDVDELLLINTVTVS